MFKLNSFNKEFSFNKKLFFSGNVTNLRKKVFRSKIFHKTCKFTTLRKVSRKVKERYISAHL